MRTFTGQSFKEVWTTTPEPVTNEAAKAAFFDSCEARINSLDEASKSLTRLEAPRETVIFDEITGEITDITKNSPTPAHAPVRAIIEYRDWADEYRIRSQAEATSGNKPPEQNGARLSEILSNRGALKISESCQYMAAKKGGYRTFTTATFAPDARERINRGETTIQKEVSRTMNSYKRMAERGWVTSKGEKVPGIEEFNYCWVVEIPENENGEKNPHVHILMNWRCEYKHWDDWKTRLEGIWKQGFAHFEKIKDTESAGAYMAKAAGYLSKGGDGGQGLVRGNRYGISAGARAPGWFPINVTQLEKMGLLIAELADHLTEKYGHKYQQRKALNQAREKVTEAIKEANTETERETLKAKKAKIAEKLAEVRRDIKKIPVRANRYQATIKGKEAYQEFMHWACSPGHYQAGVVEWLPEKQPGLDFNPNNPRPRSQWWRKIKEKFDFSKRCRGALDENQTARFVEYLEDTNQTNFYLWGVT